MTSFAFPPFWTEEQERKMVGTRMPVAETIVAAAVVTRGPDDAMPGQFICSMARPARHGDILFRIPKEWQGTQGFLTSAGRFVNRREGWAIAEAAGQLLERAPTGSRGTLFSEDVW